MPPVLPSIKQFLVADGSGEVAPIGESSTSFPAMSQLLSEADVDDNGKASLPLPATASKPAAEILLGHGIPPLPRKIVEKMINWEYVGFSELPPAKISGLKAPVDDGTILLVQSADLLKQQRRLVPNITVWVQCFCIYAGVMAMKHPDSIPDMLAYMREIVLTISIGGPHGSFTTPAIASRQLPSGIVIGQKLVHQYTPNILITSKFLFIPT